jgi:hypothetical protein
MQTQQPAAELPPFEKFPPLSLLTLVLMSLASLGIYTWWWMYSRSLILNSMLPPEQCIDSKFMHLCIGGLAVVLPCSIAAELLPENLALVNTASALGLALNLMVLFWVFLFRRGISYLLEKNGSIYQLGIFWTFLFQVFYLQIKINLVCEHRQTGIM